MKPLRNELAKFFGHLLYNDDRSIPFCKNLIIAINDSDYSEIQYYEKILLEVITMNDKFRKERTNGCFKLFIKVIENNKGNFAFMENLTSMLIKFAKKDKHYRDYFYSDKIVDKVNTWLRSNAAPPTSSLRGHN